MITHPVISAFIRKKWEKVLRVYIAQGICYFLLVVCYTAFIYYVFRTTTSQTEPSENLTTNQEITENKVDNCVFWFIVPLIFLIILHALREDFKITKH